MSMDAQTKPPVLPKRNTLVMAPGGYGKSSLLRYFCLRLVKKGQVAIFTSARDLLKLIREKEEKKINDADKVISYNDLIALGFGIDRINNTDLKKKLVKCMMVKEPGIHLFVDELDKIINH